MEKAGAGAAILLPPGFHPVHFGLPAPVLLASVTGLLIWHFWNLLRLSWWLWVDRSMTPPPGRGSWEPLLYGLHQMQLRNKNAAVNWAI